MSRSNAAASGGGSKADKAQQILQQVLQLPGNKLCAECGARQPRWASSNLGVLICLECSGIHRNLGVHISKVKSMSLDTWTVEGATQMLQLGGNTAINQKYEAYLPADRQKPTETTSRYTVEQFIRDKWERQLFSKQRTSPATSPRHRTKADSRPARVTKQLSSGYDSGNNTNTDVSVTSDSDADSLSTSSERASAAGRRVRRTAAHSSAVKKAPSSKQTVASIIPDLASLDLMSSSASAEPSTGVSAATQAQPQGSGTDSWATLFTNGSEPSSSAQPSFGFSEGDAVFASSSSSSAAVSDAAPATTRKVPATTTQSILDLYSSAPAAAAAAPPPHMQPYPHPTAQYGAYGQPSFQQPPTGYPAMPMPMQMPYQPNGMYGQPQYAQQQPISPQHHSPHYNNMGMYPTLEPTPQHSYNSSGPSGSPQWSAFATANGHHSPQHQHSQQPPANDMFFASAVPRQPPQSAQIGAAPAKPDLFADLASMSFGSAAAPAKPAAQPKPTNGLHAPPAAATSNHANGAFLDLLG